MDFGEDDISLLSKEQIIEKYQDVKLSRDRVFMIASHDLRSPFSGLLGITEMLANNPETFAAVDLKEYLSSIHESLENTYNLIENLFEWGRIERNKLDKTIEIIPFRLVLEEVLGELSQFISAKQMKISHAYDDQLLLEANSRMLEFVLRNLVKNAVKYSYRDSEIVISCEEYGEGHAIRVADKGVGISEENQQKLFKPEIVWKRHGTEGEPGTGIGLLAASRFAGYFGARIEIQSAESEGSIFSVILPTRPV